MAGPDFSTSTPPTDAAARIARLESALADRDTRIADLVRERDELRAAYDCLWLDVELMRRRIFIAKAERVDTKQLELEFKDKLAELDKLAGTIGIGSNGNGADGKTASRSRPKGRRDLRRIKMPEEHIEISNPEMDALVAQGKAERLGRLRGVEQDRVAAWRPTPARRLSGKYRRPDAADPHRPRRP